jgi:hypothetical protein
VTAFVGLVHDPPATHARATALMLEAEAGRVWPPPSEKDVEVIVAFHPAPLPRPSVIESGTV